MVLHFPLLLLFVGVRSPRDERGAPKVSWAPKEMINLATLTGAIKVALGQETAGLFSNDDSLAENLIKSGDRTFEPLWRMPIMDEHRDSMKGAQSDLCNKGNTPYGGSS